MGDRSSTVSSPRDRGPISLLLAISFIVFVIASVFVGKLPMIVLGLYLGASFIAFATYAWDKSAAQNNQRRTPENTLHLLGFIGGWPGALVAQRFLRHKSKKQSFQITFWGTVVLNSGGLIWLLTPEGSSMLNAFLSSTA